MMRAAVIAAECCMLIVLSFGVMVASSLLFVDRPEAGAGPPWELMVVVFCALLGVLTLWAGFVFSVLLKKRLNTWTLGGLLAGLFLGCAADIYFFVSGSSIGAGYLGFNFLGWLLLAALYGGPLLMAAHVGASAVIGSRQS